jgi:Porphyromonas-type peptidyl-arginine deiminase
MSLGTILVIILVVFLLAGFSGRFGEAKSDGTALGIFREVFKDLEIVSAPLRDLLYAGGNIHCITQQEPVAGIGT